MVLTASIRVLALFCQSDGIASHAAIDTLEEVIGNLILLSRFRQKTQQASRVDDEFSVAADAQQEVGTALPRRVRAMMSRGSDDATNYAMTFEMAWRQVLYFRAMRELPGDKKIVSALGRRQVIATGSA